MKIGKRKTDLITRNQQAFIVLKRLYRRILRDACSRMMADILREEEVELVVKILLNNPEVISFDQERFKGLIEEAIRRENLEELHPDTIEEIIKACRTVCITALSRVP